MNVFALALLSVLLSVAAQFSLKAGMSGQEMSALLLKPSALRSAIAVLSNPYILGGLALYGLGALAWLGVLSRWDVSKAYPLVGLGFALTVVIGALAGEQVTSMRVAGVALICLGVWMVSTT